MPVFRAPWTAPVIATFAALWLSFALIPVAAAYTINFNGLGGSPATYTENAWRWSSQYSSSGHMHSGSGGLSIHQSCCSTPYQLVRTDGQSFNLVSMQGVSGASGTITSSKGGSQSLGSGTNSFSGSQWTGVTWILWSAGGGVIDNVVVTTGCGSGAPTVSAGGPYSVNEGSSVTVSASGSGVTSWAWDLDANGFYNNGSSASVTFSAGSYDGPGNRNPFLALGSKIFLRNLAGSPDTLRNPIISGA